MQENSMKHYSLHRIMFLILRCTVAPFIVRIMRYTYHKQKGPDSPSLIISNHSTNLDPVLTAVSFSRQMYFLTSEHAMRKGFKSKLLKFAFAPIPINKSRADVTAIKDILGRLKAGANVCLFAEGDRSFTGTTGPIAPSTAKLVKTSGADLITFRLEGGYFTYPRWAKSLRRGRMTGRFVNRYSAEELRMMTVGQICDIIEQDIYEDAYQRQKANLIRYKGKRLAEDIETILYICPKCEKIGTIRSEGDRFFCSCGLDALYSETGLLNGEELPFSTITEWDLWQTEKLEDIVNNAGDRPICSDEGQTLYLIHTADGSVSAGEGDMAIDRGAFHCAGLTFPLEQIERLVVTGQMTVSFALKDGTSYEVQSDTPRSALKYREIFRILTKALTESR